MRISVIISTMDRTEYLKKCLDSLLKQEYKDFEVIVVDQSKTESTKKLSSGYKVKYVKNSLHNISHSRNIGIAYAVGEIIAFLDDDATVQSDWTKIINEVFTNVQPSYIGGKVIQILPDGKEVLQFQNGICSRYGYVTPTRPLEVPMPKDCFLAAMGVNMAFTRSILLEVNGFDEKYAYNHDETDIQQRISDLGYSKALYIDKLLVYHYYALSKNRKGFGKTNWKLDVENNIYFALKHGKHFLPIRLLKALRRVFHPRFGGFSQLLTQFKLKQVGFLEYIYNLFLEIIGLFRGIMLGLFARPRTKSIIQLSTEFIRFL